MVKKHFSVKIAVRIPAFEGNSFMSDRRFSGTSPTLLGRLRLSPENQSAWNEFVERYGPIIQGWCRHWGLQTVDAEDVTQNVLTQLSRQMRRFEHDPTKGSFRGWLKTIAYRAWCDFLDQRRRQDDQGSGDTAVLQMLSTVEAREHLLNQMEEEWNRELLEQAMDQVRQRVQPHTWEVFRLMTQENFTGPEVAEKLEMNVGAVWVAKSKVQKMIYQVVRELDGE